MCFMQLLNYSNDISDVSIFYFFPQSMSVCLKLFCIDVYGRRVVLSETLFPFFFFFGALVPRGAACCRH